ncbi:CYTH domain-containing protein [Thalassoglobus sp.]|uniref:CYTH domain-containing protein n=1 Tax=Thalassoglobus sp. TaxID=2795869 RepID=UPI003AA88F61
MGVEIERKFLVLKSYQQGEPILYRQGYLSREPGRTVRIRVAGESAWITIKSSTQNFSRQEFEYPIPLPDAQELLLLCVGSIVEKYRWRVPHGKHVWEVDEFLGDNSGLIVAEIELNSEDELFDLPPWIGEEVSSDMRYHNSNLSVHPFQQWED